MTRRRTPICRAFSSRHTISHGLQPYGQGVRLHGRFGESTASTERPCSRPRWPIGPSARVLVSDRRTPPLAVPIIYPRPGLPAASHLSRRPRWVRTKSSPLMRAYMPSISRPSGRPPDGHSARVSRSRGRSFGADPPARSATSRPVRRLARRDRGNADPDGRDSACTASVAEEVVYTPAHAPRRLVLRPASIFRVRARTRE